MCVCVNNVILGRQKDAHNYYTTHTHSPCTNSTDATFAIAHTHVRGTVGINIFEQKSRHIHGTKSSRELKNKFTKTSVYARSTRHSSSTHSHGEENTRALDEPYSSTELSEDGKRADSRARHSIPTWPSKRVRFITLLLVCALCAAEVYTSGDEFGNFGTFKYWK